MLRPRLSPSRFVALTLAASVSLIAACDSDKKDAEADKRREAAAEAMLGGDSVHSEAQKAEEEALKKAFAERKAKEEAEAAELKKEIDALLGLPEELPGDLDAACMSLIEQWEQFVKKTNQDDDGAILAFYDEKKTILGERKTKCMKVGSIEAAACSAKALADAPATLKGKGLDILSACAEKYAPDAVGPRDAPPAP